MQGSTRYLSLVSTFTLALGIIMHLIVSISAEVSIFSAKKPTFDLLVAFLRYKDKDVRQG